MKEINRVPPDEERRVIIGRTVKLRGLRGDLKVVLSTWNPERFQYLDGIWVRTQDGEDLYLNFKRVRLEGSFLYIRFKEAQLRELAEPLVGAELFIDQDQRAALPDESFYYHDDLIGCFVVDKTHGEIGQISEILDQTSQDVWVIQGNFGEIMIPAVRALVISMDLKGKLIEVDLPEGLVPVNN